MPKTLPSVMLKVLLILAVLATSFTPGSVLAQDEEPLTPLTPAPSAETGQMTDETSRLWFVEFASAPTSEGGDLNRIRGDKSNFRNQARNLNLKFTERLSFDTLWNGLSIDIEPSDVSKLTQIPGVVAIYPVVQVSLPPGGPQETPELNTALALTGADIAQSELGFTGAGVRVAVMDTGIDYDHPDLGGCFGPGCRVFTGHDFVGDAFNADPTSPAYNPTPSPDPDPDDCNGHGTHVAGIVGANGGLVGVAPGVTFGAYRVFGCEGSTTADIMIAAMERALADDMDILNMSIGSAFQWPQYPTAVAANRLVQHGVVVVASIGNSGANGLYSASAPGLGEDVIGVASFENTHIELPTFTISPDNTAIAYVPATAAPPPPTSGTFPMARTGTVTTTNDACSPLAPGSLTGYVVLIRRGGCTFYQKAFSAQSAGAAAVVLYNNSAGRFGATVAGSPPITIPVVGISDTDGALIDSRLASGPVDMTWTTQTGTFVNPVGGLISSFSSYGLAPDLSLKPDIGAPGGWIRSTYPLERGGYATISGTSMASPHVAGSVALLLQARPGTLPRDVRGLLQNSADPVVWWGGPGLGYLDNVHRQGAGMLDIDDTILSTTVITPAKLALGESTGGPFTQKLRISNNSSSDVTYDLSHVPALSTGPNTFLPSFTTDFATVSFSPTSVVVRAGRAADVRVTITPNAALADGSQYGGYVVFTPQGGGQAYRVPYAGFKGDYQSIVALTPTPSGYPWLARLVNGSYVNQPSGATFTLVNGDVPYIVFHLNHQVRRLEIEIRDAASGLPVHEDFYNAVELDYVGRNSTTTGYFAVAWDGTRIHSSGNGVETKNVPDGQYILVLKVLKALGDTNNPAHWETWTSPVVTLDRP